jgi:hypothetical protein
LERLILRMLFMSCVASIPFVIKRKSLFKHLTIFFAKGVLSTSLDSIFIKRNRIEYPVRPFPKSFDTNILFDLLFFPLLSVIWVRWTYNSKPASTILKSLVFSVPMSIIQWYCEKKTNLFKWKAWSIYHTFASINFTLFTIRGFAEILKKITEKEIPAIMDTQQKKTRLTENNSHVYQFEDISSINSINTQDHHIQ